MNANILYVMTCITYLYATVVVPANDRAQMLLDAVIREVRGHGMEHEIFPPNSRVFTPTEYECDSLERPDLDVLPRGKTQTGELTDVIGDIYNTGTIKKVFHVVSLFAEDTAKLRFYLLPQLLYVLRSGGYALIASHGPLESSLPECLRVVDYYSVAGHRNLSITVFKAL